MWGPTACAGKLVAVSQRRPSLWTLAISGQPRRLLLCCWQAIVLIFLISSENLSRERKHFRTSLQRCKQNSLSVFSSRFLSFKHLSFPLGMWSVCARMDAFDVSVCALHICSFVLALNHCRMAIWFRGESTSVSLARVRIYFWGAEKCYQEIWVGGFFFALGFRSRQKTDNVNRCAGQL